jgi:transcriptional regulator with XRE-family HTH domain
MTVGSAIPESLLWEDYYENMHDAYDAMRRVIKARGVTQEQIAVSLNADKGLISKRIHGSKNLTLKTLSFLGTALRCRLAIQFVPYEDVGAVEQKNTYTDAEIKPLKSKVTNTTDEAAEPEALRMARAV